MPETVYEENGYADRADYLESLCQDYDEESVYALSDLLGESEDFDGLVTGLQETL